MTFLGKEVKLVKVNGIVHIEIYCGWFWCWRKYREWHHHYADSDYDVVTFPDFASAKEFVSARRIQEAKEVTTHECKCV